MTPEAQIREAAKTSWRHNRGTRALPDVHRFERAFRRCAWVPPEAARKNHVWTFSHAHFALGSQKYMNSIKIKNEMPKLYKRHFVLWGKERRNGKQSNQNPKWAALTVEPILAVKLSVPETELQHYKADERGAPVHGALLPAAQHKTLISYSRKTTI